MTIFATRNPSNTDGGIIDDTDITDDIFAMLQVIPFPVLILNHDPYHLSRHPVRRSYNTKVISATSIVATMSPLKK